MTYDEVIELGATYLLPLVSDLYGLEGYDINPVQAHDGGRNVVYTCEKEGTDSRIIRISYLKDRSREDFLAELEYIRYLYENGGSVSNVVNSLKGNLLEEITHDNRTYFVCMFEKAKENRDKYYYDCGKTLGKIHQLSKGYTPVHSRYSFLDKYNADYINDLLPDSLSKLKVKLVKLLETLEGLDRDRESFGLIHFDFNDGNFILDHSSRKITVFDFDNSCYGWYMYDIADLWRIGFDKTVFEPDAEKRKKYMDNFFKVAVQGYRSETKIEDSMLDKLPLFINVTLMENIMDVFEGARNKGEEPECDEWLSYCIKCIEDDISYMGFFDEIYSHEDPFEYEVREI